MVAVIFFVSAIVFAVNAIRAAHSCRAQAEQIVESIYKSKKPKRGPCPPCSRCGSTRFRVCFCPDCGLQHAPNYDVREWLDWQRELTQRRRALSQLRSHDPPEVLG